MERGVLGPGQRVSILLNLNGEMNDAVVGETEEEDDKKGEDEDGPALCVDTLQDSVRTIQSLVDAASDGCALAFREDGQPPFQRCVSPCSPLS